MQDVYRTDQKGFVLLFALIAVSILTLYAITNSEITALAVYDRQKETDGYNAIVACDSTLTAAEYAVMQADTVAPLVGNMQTVDLPTTHGHAVFAEPAHYMIESVTITEATTHDQSGHTVTTTTTTFTITADCPGTFIGTNITAQAAYVHTRVDSTTRTQQLTRTAWELHP